MTIEELRKGYMNEVKYQKHMLRNLQYWFQLFLTISDIGVVLIYYYHAKTTWLFV
ncbi:MAG TPA: PTS fructose transporter subunit IA, partial [Lactobacillus acetotolerans]|nr:PTS fructose transporter subunit IA [Lactobacillus acetotolerans]